MPLVPRFGISHMPVSREFAREWQFNGLPTTRSCGLLDPAAFELSLRRGGCCGVDHPSAYRLCKAWVTRRLL
jgi:hypothetical protein